MTRKGIAERSSALPPAWLRALQDGEDGQGLVEYALILLLVSIVSVLILTTLGGQVSNVFQNVVTAF